MPDFVVTVPTPPRFEGDFRIEPNQNHAPTQPELAYVAVASAAVDRLAADNAADAAAGYPTDYLSSLQANRKIIASELKIEASKFCDGQNTTSDSARVTEILNLYTSGLPRFRATNPSSPRFDGDFDIIHLPGRPPNADEQTFLEKVKATLDEFAADKLSESTSDFSPYVLTTREGLRTANAKALRGRVDGFWTGKVAADVAAENVVLLRGRYQGLRDRLKRRLFNVKKIGAEPNRPGDGTNPILKIDFLGGLPAPENSPSSDKQELYVQINKTDTVIRTVCERLGEGSGSTKNHALLLRTEFLDKLQGIAVIGLELDFTALAKLTLAELRNEFFVLEAGRIKNIYVRQLGGWAGGIALVLLVAYSAISLWFPGWQWGYDHRSFLLAAGGASIGTWASFSIRQVQFSFDDLVMVEESALDPPVRILFVIVLTMTACLLFWNGAVNFEIGEFKTQAVSFKNSGSVALLVGLFAGLSERALATAISGRAAAFSKGIAGAM
jgi:hypothetical protein